MSTTNPLHTSRVRPTISRRLALLRVFLFLIATFAILVGVGMFRAMAPASYQSLTWGLCSSLLLLGLSLAFLRWERRDAASIGLGIDARTWLRLCVGIGIGAALHATQTAALLVFGGNVTLARTITAVGQSAGSSALLAVVTFFALSCMEELGFRGFALRRLDETVGRPAALFIGALAFVLLHVAYGWPLAKAFVGVSTGALLFGFAALVSGGLAVPIGVHFAWNFFGWAVGEKETPGLWHVVVSDADTARAQSVGTVSYTAVMLLGSFAFWWYDHRMKRATDRS